MVESASLGAWPIDRLETVKTLIRGYLYNDTDYFSFSPLQAQHFGKVIEKNIPLASFLYWNDVDCYIHEFRTQVRCFIADRIRAFLGCIGDIPSGMAILRQLLESACHAVSNQSLIYLVHSKLTNSVGELAKVGLATCKDLEDFLISITCINGKQLKMMEKLLEKKFVVPAGYNSKDCDVSSDKLFALTHFVAKAFDESEFYKGLPLRSVVSRMHESYKLLCKFLHPTPLLYPISNKYGRTHAMPRDEDRELVAAISFLENLEGTHVLLSELLFARRIQAAKFGELCFYASFASRGSKDIGNIEMPIIRDFMNRHKPELVFQTAEGPVTVFKR